MIFACFIPLLSAEIWEKDATEDVYIEASRDGFDRVHLECLEDFMRVRVDFDETFDGVFYTRGSYRYCFKH